MPKHLQITDATPIDGQVPAYSATTGISQWITPAVTAPDATTTSKGIVQLAGDLAGTATAPTVPGLAQKANTSSLATVATSGSYTDLTNKPTIPTVSDATTTSKGIVQLAGDLSGTAASPTVPGLATKANLNSPAFTGTPTTPTPASSDNSTTIANTSFVTAAILAAATTYDDVREYASLSAFPATGQSGYIYVADDTGYLYRWSGSIYVQVGGGNPADATTSSKGVVQLAGDLAGTAAAPTVIPATYTTSGKVKQREYNLNDYGFVGDGTTDNQTAWNNLITTVQAAGGGIVLVPRGTYVSSGAPQITGSNIIIEGMGKGSVLLLGSATLNASGTTIGLWLNGATNITVRNLTIDGNFTNIAKNGTYQTSSTLWTPIISKYGAQGPKTYIYASTGVDQTTYLTYRMPIRLTNATNVVVENCLIQNSISAGILIDADTVDKSQEIIIRNNRVKLTWDNGIYFHKGVRYGSAIGNHVSDTQYAGVTAIYCNDILTSNNVIHDNGPSPSDSAGIEYCGVIRGEIIGNTIYNSLFEGILLKNTNETGITNGFGNNYVKSYAIKVSENHISIIHDPRFPSSIAYGINVRSADRSQINNNHIFQADYGIQVGDVADDTVIDGNHVTYSYGYGISVGNSPDVTNTNIIGNTVENGADNGIEVFAPAVIRNNIIRNNAHQGIDLAAPPTGVPYKTDFVENNYIADNGYNGMQAGAGAGNLAIIKNNEFMNSDYYTYNDGVSNASTTFTSATGNFSASDVGSVIIIMGSGSSDGSQSLTTTISAVASSTSITLATATSISRSPINFSVYRQKNVYFDGSMSGANLTSATAKFTSSDVGKTVVLYSSDGPTPSLLATLTVSSVTSATVAVLSSAPTSNSNILFVIKRNYGRQARAVYIANSSDIHYTGNRSWAMSTENYNKGSISNNSFISNNFDFGSNTSNVDPISNPIIPIASSQNYTAYPGQKDSAFQMNASSAALSVYLPDTGTIQKGSVYRVKKIDTSANTVTVYGTNSQTIDTASSYVLTTPQQAATFVSDGSNWQVYSGNFDALTKSYVDNAVSTKATDSLVVHLAGTETITGTKTFSTNVNLNGGATLNATSIVTDTTTGLKIGTATTQKIGVFNATPVVQQAATTDLGTVLSNTGWRAAGTAYPITTSGNTNFSGNNTLSGGTTLSGITSATNTFTMSGPTFSTPSSITASATLNSGSRQYEICNPTAAITVTLPSTTTAGMLITIKNISTFAVTVAGTIDGATNYVLSTQYKYVTVQSTTTSGTWYVVGNN